MKKIERLLLDAGYTNLFLRFNDDHIDDIWNRRGAAGHLEELVIDDSADIHARFLAAEILHAKQADYPPQSAETALASIYANALETTEMANLWGLPGELDAAPAKHFVALGEAAIPALSELLQNEREIIYAGSREATYGNSYNYRVKDVAAFYLSQILDIPYEVHLDPSERDSEIERLRLDMSN